jgi:hypothetical protein
MVPHVVVRTLLGLIRQHCVFILKHVYSNSTAPLPLSDDTPLPSGLNITFLQCLNCTIGQSFPIVDPPPSSSLSSSEISGITMGALAGFFLLVLFLVRCCSRCCGNHQNRKGRMGSDKFSGGYPCSDMSLKSGAMQWGCGGHMHMLSKTDWQLSDSPIPPRHHPTRFCQC